MKYLLFLAILTLGLLIDAYAYQAIKTITRLKTRYNGWFRTGYWAITVVFMIFNLIGHIIADQADGPNSPVLRMVFGLFVLLYAPKLVIIAFLAAEDAYRFIRLLVKRLFFSPLPKPDGSKAETITRSEFLSRAAALTAAVPFLGMIHGMTRGLYNFQVRRETLEFDNLPPNFDGFTITQISDIHSGSLDEIETVFRGFQMINELKSDVILFTGDLVNNLAKEAEPWKEHLKALTAPHGVFSILGNHDYGHHYPGFENESENADNLNRLKQFERNLGWDLLLNEHRIIERDGQKLAILGTENWGQSKRFPKKGDLNKTLGSLPTDTFKILMTHDPTCWDCLALPHPVHFDLTLSGHTHGMQFGVEAGGYKISPVSFVYPRWAGLYEEAGQLLYVNRGFGYIGFPGRVGIFPEITQITLKRKA